MTHIHLARKYEPSLMRFMLLYYYFYYYNTSYWTILFNYGGVVCLLLSTMALNFLEKPERNYYSGNSWLNSKLYPIRSNCLIPWWYLSMPCVHLRRLQWKTQDMHCHLVGVNTNKLIFAPLTYDIEAFYISMHFSITFIRCCGYVCVCVFFKRTGKGTGTGNLE